MRPIHQLLILIAFLAAITWNITNLLVEEQPITVATITTQQRAQVASLLNGLVAHYSFDEGSGTTAGDAGTSGPFNGTLVGGATWTAGKVGSGAVSFSGTGQYVDIPGFSSLNGANAATVSFWVKPAANSKPFVGKWGTGRLFDIGSAGTALGVYWRIGGSGGTGTSLNQSTPAGVLTNGAWNHVVVVYNNPSSTIYVNGVSVATTNGAGGVLNTAVNDPLRIGWNNVPGYLSGDMDDVRLYNRAVSTQEVSDLFALGSGSTPAGNTGGGTTPPPPSATNQAPVVTLAASASGTLSSGGTAAVTLSGSATDDGLPSNTLSYTWSLSSGPSSVTFASANSASTGATFTTAGTYTINFAVSDGTLTSAKTISVTIAAANSNPVTPPPTNPPVTTGNVPAECSAANVRCVPEEYTTIQLCANAAVAGDTCLVNAGTYAEQVVTKSGGTSDSNRVTFKANGAIGTVVVRGFDIRHPYVTVNGFDITGTSANQQYIGVTKGGDNCQILNNFIHDGQRLVYGISFYSSSSTGNISGNSCLVKGNRLARLNYQFLATDGNGHRFENNIFEEGGGWDLLRVFGQDHVFYRNIFRNSAPASGIGNHPDFIQSFSDNGGRAFNMLFEENWIEGLSENPSTGYQMGQMNSGGGMNDPKLSPYFHDFTFRRNVFANISNNWNLGMPGFYFENNTFYRTAYTQGGLVSGGSLTRGDSSRLTYLSNAFIGGGTGSDTNGYYSNSGAGLGQEVLRFYVTMEPSTEANPLTPIAAGIMNDLIANGYVNGNGQPTAKGKALASVNDFVIAPAYASYKDGVYTYLKMTVDLDNNIRNTFTANYNFVSGPASAGYPAKRADSCTSGINTNFRFCEPNGVNGGDPKLKDVNDPDGPDNIPFTLDDGLKPLPGSPLCTKGSSGVDIGVYSCDSSKVFATGNSGTAGITGGSYTPTTPSTPSTPTTPPASTNTLYVSNSGSDTNTGTQAAPLKTIQKCANIAPAGTTCLVTAGIYPEHVETLQSGQSGKYIIFKAQGTVTMKGFRIKNPYIRIEGFDITKYDVGLDQGHIALEPEADYAQIVNNTIRDGIYLTSNNFTFNGANKTITNPSGGFIAAGFVPGITVYIGSDINNQIQNHDNNSAVPYKYETKRVVAVTDTTITLDAANTVFSEGPVSATIYANKAEKNGVWGIIFNSASGRGQPDNCLVQGNTFRNLAGKGIQVSGSNTIIERNVFDRMNGWRMIAFYGNNNVFRYNTFKDSPRWPGFQLPRPGTVFALGSGSWDMYDTLMTSTGSTDQTVIDNIFEYNFIKDIDEQLASVEEATSVGTPLQNRGLYIRNNVFVNLEMSGSFTRPQTILTNNTFYKSARISQHNFVIGKSTHGNPAGSIIKNNAFVDSGTPGNTDGGWYSTRGDDGLPTAGVLADYNFVAGSASTGYPSKPSFKTSVLELNGVNGGDPQFVNSSNPFGNDGIAFTPDDGLVPLGTSPLCRGGEGGNYIGAYPCPGVSYSGVTQPPTPQQPPTVQPPVVPPVVPPPVQPSTFTLTVSKTGTGSGTVEGQGIACGSDCSETVAANTRIILSATPAVGSTFTGWSGACTGTAACSVIVNSATALVAHFALVTQQTQTQDQSQNQNQTQQPPNQNQTPEAVSNTFSANVRVQTTFPLSVRSDYGISSVSIGSQSQSSHGAIVGTSKSKDGFFWWNVNFDFGVDGWVAENYLIGDKTLVDQAEQARIQQAQQRLQEANRTVAQPLIPTTSNASYKSFTFTQSLRAGTAGNQVTVLQDLLKDAGFLSGTYTKGTFDSATEQAVKTFQRQNGIVSSGTPDTTGYGALGPRTRSAFTTFARTFNGNSGSNPIGTGSSVAPITETPNTAVNQTAPAPVAGGGIVIAKLPKFTRPLILGANGPDVKNLQIFLNYSGYPIATAGVGSRGKETTFFGPATRRALIRYQEVNRSEILTPAGLRNGTGYFGPSTIKRVNKTIGK